MHLFRDEIVPKIETSDNEDHSESDKDYDPEMDKNLIDDEERGDKEDDDLYGRHKRMAEDAPPYPSEIEIVPTDAPTTTTSVGSKKRKGRGLTKSLKVTEPIHLEYNALGQPFGKWRRQYRKQIGIRICKISILYAWNEVREGLKNSL